MSTVARIRFTDYETSVGRALDAIGAADLLPADRLIIVKPNLINTDGPPVTTDVRAAEAVCAYCRSHTDAEVVIGEGCGSGTTGETFEANGYTDLARRIGVRLIDFNTAPSVRLQRDDTMQLREFHLPEIAVGAFIISLPVLKDHSFTKTTIAMKNMYGLAPAPFYKGAWNKSKLHTPSVDRSVVDICLYTRPDLCVVDASVALTGMHLAGVPKRLDLILASADCVAVDAVGSELLGHDPHSLEYLTLAHGVLGDMDAIEIIDG